MSKSPRIDSAVLAQLQGIPPLTHLGETADQQAAWRDVRDLVGTIHSLMKAYFDGCDGTYILDGLKPCDRRASEAIYSYYMAFYDLVWWHWKDISKAASHTPGFPKEPGEACLLLIKLEAAAMLASAHQPHDRYSIKGHRESSTLRRQEESNAATGLENPDITKRLRKLDQFDDYLKPFFQFKRDVVLVCEKGRRTKRQRKLLKDFAEADGERHAAIEARLHPRHKVSGWEWRDGIKSRVS